MKKVVKVQLEKNEKVQDMKGKIDPYYRNDPMCRD